MHCGVEGLACIKDGFHILQSCEAKSREPQLRDERMPSDVPS